MAPDLGKRETAVGSIRTTAAECAGELGRRSALDPGEVAERTAYYVARMRDAGMAASGLPSADTVVRACLDAIPVALDHVVVLTDRQNQHALERQEVLDSRRARNLLIALATSAYGWRDI